MLQEGKTSLFQINYLFILYSWIAKMPWNLRDQNPAQQFQFAIQPAQPFFIAPIAEIHFRTGTLKRELI